MSKTLFQPILAASLVTLVVFIHLIAEWSGHPLMGDSLFGTLRVVAATLWITAVAIACTEAVITRIDLLDRPVADSDDDLVHREDRSVATAVIARLGGSRTKNTHRPGQCLTPVD